MNTTIFMLFADCIPVLGSKKALICDLGRGQITHIPQSLYRFIEQFEGQDLTELMTTAVPQQREIISDYLKHLEDNELIFWCKPAHAALFPKIKPRWQSFSTISNAIIEFNPAYNYAEMLFELDHLGCSYYQFRLTDLDEATLVPFYAFLQTLCEQCQNLNMFEVLVPHQCEQADEQFAAYIKRYMQLGGITFYNHVTDARVLQGHVVVQYKTHALNHQHAKSVSSEANFFPNYDFFFESRTRNPYYNGKITIDFDGNIKNIIADVKSWGNIHTHSISHVIAKPDFRQLWFSTKDKVKGCRDCEFRYVCFDTRPLVYNANDQMYEPTIACNYDPDTGEWSTDSE